LDVIVENNSIEKKEKKYIPGILDVEYRRMNMSIAENNEARGGRKY
jgi:hypothetical protein